MKTYQKIGLGIVASALLFNVAMAENSGAFVGLGLGMSDVRYNINTQNNGENSRAYDHKNVFSGGVLAGYKQFFGESFGARYYLSVDTNTANIKREEFGAFMTYAANADLLYNFVKSSSTELGVFLGVGLGATHITHIDSKLNKLFSEDGGENAGGINVKSLGFYAGVNAGIRTIIADNHAIELAARIPITTQAIFKVNEPTLVMEATGRQNYALNIRYTFSF